KPDLQIAKTVKVSATTVGTVRREMEAKGDVSKLETRTDRRGRGQPARKPRKPTKRPAAPPPTPAVSAATRGQAQGAGQLNQGQEATARLLPPPPGPPKQAAPPPPRDDIGPDSAAEAARLRSCVETLQAEKRCLKLKVEGLEREIADLKDTLATF